MALFKENLATFQNQHLVSFALHDERTKRTAVRFIVRPSMTAY